MLYERFCHVARCILLLMIYNILPKKALVRSF